MAQTDLIRGRQVVEYLTNKSGGAIIAGDVVITDTSNDESFTTTTSASYNTTRLGIAQESIANNAQGRILVEGYAALVNVNASASRGNYLFTHTVAKQASSSATRAAGAFGMVRKAGTTPSATIWGVPDATAASGATLSTVDASLSGDVTMTNANTFYDGPSGSFAAGTWLIVWKMLIQPIVATGQSYVITAKLWDGSTVYDETETTLSYTATNVNGFPWQITGEALVVLSGTATLKISAASIRGSSATKIARDPADNSSTNHTATRITGVKVA